MPDKSAQKPKEIKDQKKVDVDWAHIGDYIYELYMKRKRKRLSKEKIWAEVDRQIRMEPDVAYKTPSDGDGNDNEWMPEMELPDQAIAHEVLKSDALRMMFPDTGSFFKVFAGIDDKIIKAFKNMEFMEGEDVRAVHEYLGGPEIDQEDINLVTQAYLEANMSQYDFKGHWDMVNGEAFKYGTGVGRMKLVEKSVIARTAQGSMKRKVMLPVFLPRSIKNIYLDDNKHSIMNEGYQISQGDIEVRSQRIDDLRIAANKGSNDMRDMNGGWMPANLHDVTGDDDGLVEILEYEGDLVVPKKHESGSMIMYNYIITVVAGKGLDKADKGVRRVVRCRSRSLSLPSYIVVPYDREGIDDPYGSGPLMKGYPIQKSSSESLNRALMAMALDTQPPVRYDQDDHFFSAAGGPRLFPGSQMATMGKIDVLDVGNPASMLQAYTTFRSQYADATGMTGPRLGQQTNSHTTAYAKGSELERGQIRTVDYVRNTLGGPMKQCLQVMYEMGKQNLSGDMPVFMNSAKMFIKINKDVLPEDVHFEVYGSGGPAEDTAKSQQKMAAIQLAMNIDQIKVNLGLGEPLNYEEIQKQILKEGGIEDVERFNIQSSAQGAAPTPPMAEPNGNVGAGGTTSTALQGINFGQRG